MINVKNLTKLYGPRPAIIELNFEIKKGEIVGFLGPNGAGKTTTMKILTGFMPATTGQAFVDGKDVFEDPIGVKSIVGYLPENPPIYMDMTVLKYLEYVGRLKNIEKKDLKAAVARVLEQVDLGSVSGRLIGNLSKGFRQRVGLAQAMIHNPKVLILDEPTAGLDPVQIIEIRNLIKSLGGDHTVILSSHILPEVTATCERIIVIHKGRIVAQDSMNQLSKRMKKGQVYNLQYRKASAGCLEAIKKIQGVSEVKSSNHTLEIQIDEGSSEIRDKIVETAVTNGMGVLEFKSEQMSLEDVFLELTTSE